MVGRRGDKNIELKTFRSLAVVGLAAAVVWAVSSRPWALGPVPYEPPWRAPELTHSAPRDWINSRPLKLTELEGRVVLVDFWAYGCWNCRRSLPWVKALAAQFSDDGLVVLGVHTPEFKYEMDRGGVRRHVEQLGLEHPVMLDNDFSYWNAMDNRYWPTFYLIDKSGRVRDRVIGEVLPGSDKARRIEALLRTLLAETV